MTVVHRELFVGHGACEDEAIVQQAELGHQRADRRIIARHHVGTADENEAVVGIDVPFVLLREADVVLDLLVRRDPADEQKIHQAVVENAVERWAIDAPRDA